MDGLTDWWMGGQLGEGRDGRMSTFTAKDPLALHCIPGGDGETHTHLENPTSKSHCPEKTK